MRCRDQPITISKQKASAVADAHGHIDLTSAANWETHTTGWASCVSKGGREFWKQNLVAADVSHVWKCNYSDDLAAATPKMRLVHNSLDYEIVSVIDVDMAHETVEIQTKREV